jgi:membrane fusion protein, multidrug efflux system
VRSRVDGELMRVNVIEGQTVQAGEVIAEIDPRPFQVQLEQAQGQLQRDEAALANAKIDLERYRVLVAQDSIPKQQYDTQIATVRQAEATITVDQGLVDAAKLQLIYARITSPVTGRIGLRQVDPGNIVHATDTTGLFVITTMSPINIVFSLGQDDIPRVMKRVRAGNRLVVEAYNRDMKEKLATGSLLTVDNQVDVTTGTVRLKAVFSNDEHALFPNQFVNARLLVDVHRGVVVVPTAAVQRGPDSTFVFVVKPDNTIDVRKVLVGPIESGMAEIEQGLSAGEIVVTQGVDKLQQGSQVSVQMAQKR